MADTNVIISALFFPGPLATLRRQWMARKLLLLVSGPVLNEYRLALAYKKFKRSPAEVAADLNALVLPFCEGVVLSNARLASRSRDAKDDIFLRTARDGKATALISGDQDLLVLNGSFPFPILKPAEFMARHFPTGA